jgi:hypothetical protein
MTSLKFEIAGSGCAAFGKSLSPALGVQSARVSGGTVPGIVIVKATAATSPIPLPLPCRKLTGTIAVPPGTPAGVPTLTWAQLTGFAQVWAPLASAASTANNTTMLRTAGPLMYWLPFGL